MAKYIFLIMVFILFSLKPITATEKVSESRKMINTKEIMILRDSLEQNSCELIEAYNQLEKL